MIGHTKDKVLRGVLRLYLILFSLLVIAPLIWAIYTSFKTNQEFFQNPWSLPKALNFQNYVNAWNKAKIGTYFLNSVIVTFTVVVVVAILGSTTAYVCTRFKFKTGNATVLFYMAGMFIPSVLCAVPMFLQLQKIHLLDSLPGLILIYIATSLPFTIFVLAGFFRTLPHELEEAAYIDGCSLNQTFWLIMLPLVKPGLATVSIFNFLGAWNEFVLAKTLIFSDANNTLPLGLVSLLQSSRSQTDWGSLFAALIIVMIPTLIIYILFQKSIKAGITVGAVKG